MQYVSVLLEDAVRDSVIERLREQIYATIQDRVAKEVQERVQREVCAVLTQQTRQFRHLF